MYPYTAVLGFPNTDLSEKMIGRTQEKGSGAMWESTGSYILLVLHAGERVEGAKSLEWRGGEGGRAPPPSASWAENTITECTQGPSSVYMSLGHFRAVNLDEI